MKFFLCFSFCLLATSNLFAFNCQILENDKNVRSVTLASGSSFKFKEFIFVIEQVKIPFLSASANKLSIQNEQAVELASALFIENTLQVGNITVQENSRGDKLSFFCLSSSFEE